MGFLASLRMTGPEDWDLFNYSYCGCSRRSVTVVECCRMLPVAVVAVPVTVMVYVLAERARELAVLMRSPQPVARSRVTLRSARVKSLISLGL